MVQVYLTLIDDEEDQIRTPSSVKVTPMKQNSCTV